VNKYGCEMLNLWICNCWSCKKASFTTA